MKANLCVVGYKPITQIAKKISSEFRNRANFSFIEAALEEALPFLRKIDGVADIILTGPSTRKLNAQKLSIPIISFRPTFPDLIKAIQEARKYNKNIAICLSGDDFDFDLALLSQVMNVSLFPAYCDAGEDYKNAIRTFKERDLKVMIGGALPTMLAKEIGLKGVCFYKGMDMIRTAVQNALEICHINREGIRRISQLTAVVTNFSDGLVMTDEKGKIIFDNPTARGYLGFEELQGKKLNNLLENDLSNEILKEGNKVLNVVVKGNLVVNYIPIRSAEGIHGLVCTLKKVDEIQDAEFIVRKKLYERGFVTKYNIDDIIGKSQAIKSCKEWANQFAMTESPILITGETGTGKELFAHSIHNMSHLRAGPFVAINCATLPSELLESELFGYEKGAFTGAHTSGKKGLIELAHKGTLFLDEITSLSNALQAKLLRLLSEQEILKLGSDRIIPVEIRIIAATNENIESSVREHRFREDLYYRLNIFRLHIPPLLERPEDIVPLFIFFVKKYRGELATIVSKRNREIHNVLDKENFQGNVRELENIAKRFCLLFKSDEDSPNLKPLLEACLEKKAYPHSRMENPTDLKKAIQNAEKMVIQELLGKYKNRSEMSKALNLHRSSLWRKMKTYGI